MKKQFSILACMAFSELYPKATLVAYAVRYGQIPAWMAEEHVDQEIKAQRIIKRGRAVVTGNALYQRNEAKYDPAMWHEGPASGEWKSLFISGLYKPTLKNLLF